ncbi:MAG: hypothetical protein ACOCRK_05785 [bacterium]
MKEHNWVSCYFTHFYEAIEPPCRHNTLYFYDITDWRIYHGIKNEWYVEDLQKINDFHYLLGFEIIVSSKDLPIKKIGFLTDLK